MYEMQPGNPRAKVIILKGYRSYGIYHDYLLCTDIRNDIVKTPLKHSQGHDDVAIFENGEDDEITGIVIRVYHYVKIGSMRTSAGDVRPVLRAQGIKERLYEAEYVLI
jgi:hypothetical protein